MINSIGRRTPNKWIWSRNRASNQPHAQEIIITLCTYHLQHYNMVFCNGYPTTNTRSFVRNLSIARRDNAAMQVHRFCWTWCEKRLIVYHCTMLPTEKTWPDAFVARTMEKNQCSFSWSHRFFFYYLPIFFLYLVYERNGKNTSIPIFTSFFVIYPPLYLVKKKKP